MRCGAPRRPPSHTATVVHRRFSGGGSERRREGPHYIHGGRGMISFRSALLLSPLLILGAARTTPAQPAADAVKNDYGDAKTWLCRPGRQDACAVDLTTTI